MEKMAQDEPTIGDLISFSDDPDEEVAMVLEVLDRRDHYCKGLGCYPDHVFRVLLQTGEVVVWDFYDSLLQDHEWKIISKHNR